MSRGVRGDCITQLRRQQKDQQRAVGFDPRDFDTAQHNGIPFRYLTTQLITDLDDLQHYMESDTELQAFFVLQHISYSPLQTSYDLYTELCRGRDVSPQFNDYILYFGS